MKTLLKAYLLYLLVGCLSIVLWWPSSLWELHLFPSHEFDYLHLINLLLQNQYYIFPVIQKSFLNSGSFQSLYYLMITPFTTWRIFHFFNFIASFVLFSFFFPFPFFLPSFLFVSFFSVVSLSSKWTKSAKNTRMNCCSILGSLKMLR